MSSLTRFVPSLSISVDLFYIVCSVGVSTGAPTWVEVRGYFGGVGFLFPLVGPEDRTQLVRRGSK